MPTPSNPEQPPPSTTATPTQRPSRRGQTQPRPEPAGDEVIALFRFAVIAALIHPRLPAAERGAVARELAATTHEHPDFGPRRYSRGTIDRWVRAYRAHGLDGLRPVTRADAGTVRAHRDLFDEAAALRAEVPARSSGAIADILWHRHGVAIPERTIRAVLRRRGLHRAALAAAPAVFGRYQADRPNEVWIGDVLVGPFVPHPRVAGSKRARLFLLVDDHSRLLVHGRWVSEENTRAGQDVLRAAITRRGCPRTLYVDNGAPYAAAALARSCAVLGIRLVHSKPHRPQGRGKQERLNRFIRERFLAEATHVGITDLAELNDRFTAWAERVANTRVHAETGRAPIEAFTAGEPPRLVDQAALAEAFRWSATRVVTRTATVSLAGNRYQVDPALVGARVELRYDPEDLTRLQVYHVGRPAGDATPFLIGRHVHPSVPQARRDPVPPTGVDYLGLVLAAHTEAILAPIAYRDVPAADPDTDITDTDTDTDTDDAGRDAELSW